MSRRPLFLLAGLLCLLVPQAPCRAADEKPLRLPLEAKDIEASLGTDWYGVYIQGKKAGFFNSTRTLSGKGTDVAYVDASYMHMKLVSFGQKSEMEMTQTLEFDAKPPFALRRGDVVEKDGKGNQRYQLVPSGKGFTFIYTTGRDKRVKEVPAIDYTLADSMTEEVWIRRGAKVGDHIVTRSFDLKELDLDLHTSKLIATKTSLVNGVTLTFHEIETVSQKIKLTGLSRHDQKGRLLSGTIAGFIELRLEPEAKAKNTEYSADLFVLGMVKIDKKLGRPQEVSALAVEVVGKEGVVLPSGPRQLVVANKAGTHTLKVGKRYGTTVKATAKEIEEALAETRAYPITDPKVIALAKEAVADAKTPPDKVKRLVLFVNDFIDPKLTANAPNLYDLLERKEGDCKSYALLFTTLARAAGIPAREVSGLVYMGDDAKAFGGHAWNEVVLDGVWVPVDASCGETEIDATHISFGNETQAMQNMVSAMGKLKFKLIEVQREK
jgi:hypothetical protein